MLKSCVSVKPVNTGEVSGCHVCGQFFPSYQQRCLHAFKAHGIKNVLSQYLDTTFCTVCLRQFTTREGVLNHAKYRSKVCRHNLFLRGPILTVEQAGILDNECKNSNIELYKKSRRRHHVTVPAFRMQGPLMPIFQIGDKPCANPLGFGHNYLSLK